MSILPSDGDLRNEKETDKRAIHKKVPHKVSPAGKARVARKSSLTKAR
jgi:hypothetical protein